MKTLAESVFPAFPSNILEHQMSTRLLCKYHRITEQSSSLNSCSKQEQLEWIAESCTQLGFEYLQGFKLVSYAIHFQSEQVFSYV